MCLISQAMGKSLQTLGECGTSCARLLTTQNYLPVIGDMRHLNFFTARILGRKSRYVLTSAFRLLAQVGCNLCPPSRAAQPFSDLHSE